MIPYDNTPMVPSRTLRFSVGFSVCSPIRHPPTYKRKVLADPPPSRAITKVACGARGVNGGKVRQRKPRAVGRALVKSRWVVTILAKRREIYESPKKYYLV